MPEIVEGKLEKRGEVSPTDCGIPLDYCEKFELVGADEVVDERGKKNSRKALILGRACVLDCCQGGFCV